MDDLRKQVADIFVDAHQSTHWTCGEEDCHENGSPINRIMALIASYTEKEVDKELKKLLRHKPDPEQDQRYRDGFYAMRSKIAFKTLKEGKDNG